MARLARLVVPGAPHHVTQRGNGRQQVFFNDGDYSRYRDWLGESCRAADVEIWGWVLMPNHVHLILVPSNTDGLRRALAPLHRRYAGHIHARQRRTGHFWQGRFGCVAMDEPHLLAALRYITLNPVRARLTERAEGWRWSSVHAHLGEPDGITETAPVVARVSDFAALIARGEDAEASERLRRAELIGRPVGSTDFVARIEALSGRTLAPRVPGRKRRTEIGALST